MKNVSMQKCYRFANIAAVYFGNHLDILASLNSVPTLKRVYRKPVELLHLPPCHHPLFSNFSHCKSVHKLPNSNKFHLRLMNNAVSILRKSQLKKGQSTASL